MPHGHTMPMCESVFTEERGVELVISGGWDHTGVAHNKVNLARVFVVHSLVSDASVLG